MPVTSSAKKKLRVDQRRTVFNLRLKRRYKETMKNYFEKKTPEALKHLYALVDRAVKKHIIHQNKAARLKSRAAKALSKQSLVKKIKTNRPKKTKILKAKTKLSD